MQNQENVVKADNVVEFGFQKTSKDYSKVQKILGRILVRGLVFVYNIIGLIATVNTFRGFWYLFDNYFEVNHDFLTGTSNELLRQINQTEHIENAEERKYPVFYPTMVHQRIPKGRIICQIWEICFGKLVLTKSING